MRAILLCCAVLLAAPAAHASAQAATPAPLAIVDVPFISQSELLCGGAAAAMVLRYWGERQASAEAFVHLVDRSAAGIRTGALVADLRRRGWNAHGVEGDETAVRRELTGGRPVLMLIEDRPSAFHYVVTVAWHERGVIFHDPARGPFRVMSTPEFVRRWRAARRWMAIVVPGSGIGDRGSGIGLPIPDQRSRMSDSPDPRSPTPDPRLPCEQAIAHGVRLAQSGELEGAERVLATALRCPGATRELAGVRVLQKRWPEAADLASAALAADRGDTYAWKVLATSRFVRDDRLGALDAWNQIGEPRVDLVQIDGLTRTQHRVVERLLDVRRGDLLTPQRFARARRQLADLPSAASARLEYVPVTSGLAEVRGAVAERPVVPHGRSALAATVFAAAATREVRLTSGAPAGGGERLSGGWRFWPHRQRVDAGVRAPAPWGGLWRVDAFSERQPFTTLDVGAARAGARLGLSDWATGHVRWNLLAGVDEWARQNPRGVIGGAVEWISLGDRVAGAARVDVWPGRADFTTLDLSARASSSADGEFVVAAVVTAQLASRATPPDLWWGGDTGHARATLLRAHPLLEDGRLRVDRLGRTVVHASIEARRWWRVARPIRAAAAVFSDVARTGLRLDGPALRDVDAGIGGRLAVAGVPGVFRVDLARGLRDGATAVSIGYEP